MISTDPLCPPPPVIESSWSFDLILLTLFNVHGHESLKKMLGVLQTSFPMKKGLPVSLSKQKIVFILFWISLGTNWLWRLYEALRHHGEPDWNNKSQQLSRLFMRPCTTRVVVLSEIDEFPENSKQPSKPSKYGLNIFRLKKSAVFRRWRIYKKCFR